MSDDEELGTVTQPARVRGPQKAPTPVLERHPATGDEVRGCARCGRPGFGYRHPNPLRPGVVLWRCPRHRRPTTVVESPKDAPGGGVYR